MIGQLAVRKQLTDYLNEIKNLSVQMQECLTKQWKKQYQNVDIDWSSRPFARYVWNHLRLSRSAELGFVNALLLNFYNQGSSSTFLPTNVFPIDDLRQASMGASGIPYGDLLHTLSLAYFFKPLGASGSVLFPTIHCLLLKKMAEPLSLEEFVSRRDDLPAECKQFF